MNKEINFEVLEQDEISVEIESENNTSNELLLALGPNVSNKEWQE